LVDWKLNFIKNCGLMIEPQQGMSLGDVLSWAKYAEGSGYGYIFRSDHLLPIGRRRKGISSPECWVSLGAIAATTKRIKFGPMVSPIGFRNPAILGRMACTLHAFSKGRLQLGVGAGWYEEEYKAHGLGFPSFQIRSQELSEALNILTPMVRGKRVDFEGKYFTAHVDCFPKPYRTKVNLIGGGRNRNIVRTLAKHIDEWNIFNSPLSVFSRLKLELGRARGNSDLEFSQMGSFIIAENERELAITKKSYMRGMGLSGDPDTSNWRIASKGILCGTPEEIVSQLNDRRKAGITRFYFQLLYNKNKETVALLTSTLREGF
jgi:alkanesulfonate monooxygenase SsuD/methylene tetrahydromethanopterin reductase-like flavin-dependent oxidoreductase (luciferase family)